MLEIHCQGKAGAESGACVWKHLSWIVSSGLDDQQVMQRSLSEDGGSDWAQSLLRDFAGLIGITFLLGGSTLECRRD